MNIEPWTLPETRRQVEDAAREYALLVSRRIAEAREEGIRIGLGADAAAALEELGQVIAQQREEIARLKAQLGEATGFSNDDSPALGGSLAHKETRP